MITEIMSLYPSILYEMWSYVFRVALHVKLSKFINLEDLTW